jgi:hypothetical protein
MSLGEAAKAVVAGVVAAGGALVTALTDNVLTGEEIGGIVTVAIVAWGLTFGFSSRVITGIKAITAAVVTFGGTWLTANSDGNVTSEEWQAIIASAVAVAAAVFATINSPVSVDKSATAQATAVAGKM